jgi:hypothetical protein
MNWVDRRNMAHHHCGVRGCRVLMEHKLILAVVAAIRVSYASEGTHSRMLNAESTAIDEASWADVVGQTPQVEDTVEPVVEAHDLACRNEDDSTSQSSR